MVERSIAHAYEEIGEQEYATQFRECANTREKALMKYCWNNECSWFYDYYLPTRSQKKTMTLAGTFALWAEAASPAQAERAAQTIKNSFLQTGGLVTTLIESGQQRDAPNGWAPLHYAAIVGLEQYRHSSLAEDIAQRCCHTVVTSYARDDVLIEKYNIEMSAILAGGGEYELQIGFGWTNGITLYLLNRYSGSFKPSVV